METYIPILTSIGSLFGFVVFWYVLIAFIAKVAGWGKIAERFPYSGFTGSLGERKRFQSIKIGLSNYNGVTHFESLPQGLHMSVMLLFKPGHPDILIPWHELLVTENKGIFQNMYQFGFASLPGKSFYTYHKLGEWILGERGKYIVN